jgi:hypothetical protein
MKVHYWKALEMNDELVSKLSDCNPAIRFCHGRRGSETSILLTCSNHWALSHYGYLLSRVIYR